MLPYLCYTIGKSSHPYKEGTNGSSKKEAQTQRGVYETCNAGYRSQRSGWH